MWEVLSLLYLTLYSLSILLNLSISLMKELITVC